MRKYVGNFFFAKDISFKLATWKNLEKSGKDLRTWQRNGEAECKFNLHCFYSFAFFDVSNLARTFQHQKNFKGSLSLMGLPYMDVITFEGLCGCKPNMVMAASKYKPWFLRCILDFRLTSNVRRRIELPRDIVGAAGIYQHCKYKHRPNYNLSIHEMSKIVKKFLHKLFINLANGMIRILD